MSSWGTVDGLKNRTDIQEHVYISPRSPQYNVEAEASDLLGLVRFVLYHCRGPMLNIVSGGAGEVKLETLRGPILRLGVSPCFRSIF